MKNETVKKAKYAAGAALCLMVISCACRHKEGGGSIASYTISGKESRIYLVNDTMSLEIKYTGDIEFTDDEMAIKSISPKGYLQYKKGNSKLSAEGSIDSGLVIEIYDGQQRLALDDHGRKYMAEAVKEMIAQGIGAKDRVNRTLKNGGVQAVWTMTAGANSDRLKGIYFGALLENDTLSQQEMIETAKKIAASMNSASEKKDLLSRVAPIYLKDGQTSAAYFAAVETIKYNNEKADVLRNILEQPLTVEQYGQLQQAAGTISDDNRRAEVLSLLTNAEKQSHLSRPTKN
jgi:hypothetical protein